MIYALRIISRTGLQKNNGYWRIGSFINNEALSQPTAACKATFNTIKITRTLRHEFNERFPEIRLQIVRFDENIPWTNLELSRDERKRRKKRR